MTITTERLNKDFEQGFIEDLNKIFPWYPKDELTELLCRPGWAFLPVDLRLYLSNIYYPNNLEQILEFFDTPEKPIEPFEFYHFWTYLTPIERIEFKFADLS